MLCFILFIICTSSFAVVGTQVLKLDGKHYVEMKDAKPLNLISKQLTIEARVRVASFNGWWTPVVYKGDGTSPGYSGRSYTLWINQGDSVHFASAPERNSQTFVNSPPGSIRLNRWHHIAGVIDCTTRRMILYVDGRVVARTTYGNRIHQSRLPLRIGWSHENSLEYGYFHGMIDEVRIWNIVRTQDEIRQKMRKPLKGNEKGLVGYWTFDDTTAKDHSPSKNHGTLKKGILQRRRQVAAPRNRSWNITPMNDIGGIVTADGRKVKEGQVYFSGIPPQDTIIQLAKEGRLKTVINYLAEWEMPSFQRYEWSKNDDFNVFHFPYGWTNSSSKWARDWHRDRRAVIAQLVLKYNTPIKETFAVLADEKNYPVLYYCRGGFHRSMIVISVLYLVLGVSEKHLFDGRGQANALNRSRDGRWVFRTVFDSVNKRGGIKGYLKSIGVPAKQIENFKRNMLMKRE